MISRRHFTALLVASFSSRAFSKTDDAQSAGRKLDFQIDTKGFGDVGAADLTAVIRSAAETIWQYCPNTHWEEPGFYVYHSRLLPITLDDHRPDGRIAIGLTPSGTYWSQFAFQFAHEFCHALAGHSNDWHKTWIEMPKSNHWLEESLCETASLFALRDMGKSWKTAPPYVNWKDYAPSLTKYATDRINAALKDLPADKSFINWFRENEPAMRANPVIRPKNNVVANQLLPIFEATPSGWEAVTYYNLVKREPAKLLAAQFTDWWDAVPEAQKKFVASLANVFKP